MSPSENLYPPRVSPPIVAAAPAADNSQHVRGQSYRQRRLREQYRDKFTRWTIERPSKEAYNAQDQPLSHRLYFEWLTKWNLDRLQRLGITSNKRCSSCMKVSGMLYSAAKSKTFEGLEHADRVFSYSWHCLGSGDKSRCSAEKEAKGRGLLPESRQHLPM